jgi:hypothetical protein
MGERRLRLRGEMCGWRFRSEKLKVKSEKWREAWRGGAGAACIYILK